MAMGMGFPCPQRYGFTAWLARHDRLATHSLLFSRHCSTDPFCPECNHAVESTFTFLEIVHGSVGYVGTLYDQIVGMILWPIPPFESGFMFACLVSLFYSKFSLFNLIGMVFCVGVHGIWRLGYFLGKL